MTSGTDNISNLSDEQLVILTLSGDTVAENQLLEKYKETVKITAAVFTANYLSDNFSASLEFDDLIQEGLLGLKAAVCSYDPKKNTTFRTYASKCISNAMLNAIKKVMRKKNTPPGGIVSLEELEIPSELSLEEKFISDEEAGNIRLFLKNELSRLEFSVIDLFLEGDSYREISDKLNITEKSVDNAVQRVRSKLSRFLSENRS